MKTTTTTTWQKLEAFADECVAKAEHFDTEAEKALEKQEYEIAIHHYCWAIYWWLRPALDNQERECQLTDAAYVDAVAVERLLNKVTNNELKRLVCKITAEAKRRMSELNEIYWSNLY